MSAPEIVQRAPFIRTVGLGCRFIDGAWAFRDINFSLFSGQIAVLAGRNGAGKTIFAKHLAGLLVQTEGSVLISGQDMRALQGNRAESIGYLFQDARLQIVGETVLDDALFGPMNLGLSPAEALARAQAALFACGLADRENDFVHKLSGGELRCLAIAGVLAMKPKAVVLDEPFANLDLEGVQAVLRIARDMADEGIAILVVTHEIEKILGLARDFTVMDNGRIVLSGRPTDVLARGIEYYGLRDPFRPHLDVEDLTWLDEA
jgi:energy-coupling factor transporter ATP-binding protein EcfA2